MPVFIDVPGLEWLFAVSRCGRVLRKGRETATVDLGDVELKVRTLNSGGGRSVRGVRVTIGGKRKEFSLRALLRRTFGEEKAPLPARTTPAPHEDRVMPAGESRPIPGFDGYLAWSNGAITGPFGRPLLQKRSGRYRATVLRTPEGKARELKTHRLVLEAFVGPRPPGMVGCHGYGGPLDNSVGNLRWDTPAANTADRVACAKLRRYGLL